MRWVKSDICCAHFNHFVGDCLAVRKYQILFASSALKGRLQGVSALLGPGIRLHRGIFAPRRAGGLVGHPCWQEVVGFVE